MTDPLIDRLNMTAYQIANTVKASFPDAPDAITDAINEIQKLRLAVHELICLDNCTCLKNRWVDGKCPHDLGREALELK